MPHNRPNRPARSERVYVSITPDLYALLEAEALMYDSSLSAVVRRCLEAAFVHGLGTDADRYPNTTSTRPGTRQQRQYKGGVSAQR